MLHSTKVGLLHCRCFWPDVAAFGRIWHLLSIDPGLSQGHDHQQSDFWHYFIGKELFDMKVLILRAYVKLVFFEFYTARGRFSELHEKVRNTPIKRKRSGEIEVDRICSAVDLACVYYFKQVLCLQRSAVTACILKRQGVFAQLVIGAQHTPFKAHAWVEVDGRVVNDKPYVSEVYPVLDRC